MLEPSIVTETWMRALIVSSRVSLALFCGTVVFYLMSVQLLFLKNVFFLFWFLFFFCVCVKEVMNSALCQTRVCVCVCECGFVNMN